MKYIEQAVWVSRASFAASPVEAAMLVAEVMEDPYTNRPVMYGLAQEQAGRYISAGKPVPPGLVSTIQLFAGEPSGFTGITVHHAWISSLPPVEVK